MLEKLTQPFFQKSQKLLHLDTAYFAKASFYGFIQQFIGALSGLSISYLFGHFISKKAFGDYNLILSVLGFLTLVTLPGLDNYLTRSISQKYDSSYLRGIKIKFLCSLTGIPILLTLSLYYYLNNQIQLSTAFLITSLFFPLLAPFQLFNELLTARHKYKLITIFLSLSSIISLLLIGSSIIFTHNLVLITISYLLSMLIPSAFGTMYAFKFVKSLKKKDKDLMPMGIFNTLLTILPWSSGYLGQIILATSVSTEKLAVYAVATKLPSYVQKNLFVFHRPITAKLASQSYKEHLQTVKKHFVKLLLWGFLLAAPIYILSPYLINIIFTTKYADAVFYAQILSLSVIPLPLSWVISDILVFQKIKKPRLFNSMILDSSKIILYIVAIPIFQLNALVLIFIIDRYLSMFGDILILFISNRHRIK